DIGGGTTDFTLIAVTESGGELTLNRIAVGEHILLGGDNVDLALAGVVAHRLADKGTGLVGGTIKASLLRSDIEQVLGEGFLPAVASTDMPAAQRRVGLQELGLPYAAD